MAAPPPTIIAMSQKVTELSCRFALKKEQIKRRLQNGDPIEPVLSDIFNQVSCGQSLSIFKLQLFKNLIFILDVH